MGQGKNINSKQFIEEAIDNIRNDRAMASSLLIELMKILKQDETKHQYSGPVAAKYLETLQRSNEQLVKITALMQKKEGTNSGITEKDKEHLKFGSEHDVDFVAVSFVRNASDINLVKEIIPKDVKVIAKKELKTA